MRWVKKRIELGEKCGRCKKMHVSCFFQSTFSSIKVVPNGPAPLFTVGCAHARRGARRTEKGWVSRFLTTQVLLPERLCPPPRTHLSRLTFTSTCMLIHKRGIATTALYSLLPQLRLPYLNKYIFSSSLPFLHRLSPSPPLLFFALYSCNLLCIDPMHFLPSLSLLVLKVVCTPNPGGAHPTPHPHRRHQASTMACSCARVEAQQFKKSHRGLVDWRRVSQGREEAWESKKGWGGGGDVRARTKPEKRPRTAPLAIFTTLLFLRERRE